MTESKVTQNQQPFGIADVASKINTLANADIEGMLKSKQGYGNSNNNNYPTTAPVSANGGPSTGTGTGVGASSGSGNAIEQQNVSGNDEREDWLKMLVLTQLSMKYLMNKNASSVDHIVNLEVAIEKLRLEHQYAHEQLKLQQEMFVKERRELRQKKKSLAAYKKILQIPPTNASSSSSAASSAYSTESIEYGNQDRQAKNNEFTPPQIQILGSGRV